MTTATTLAIVAAAAAVAAVIVSLFALRWARRSAVAAESSAGSARDAAVAARDDADVALRAEKARLAAEEEAAVSWQVDWPRNSWMVTVKNTGQRTAYQVGVALSPYPATGGGPILLPNTDEVNPGGAMRVDVSAHEHTGAWIELSWYLDREGAGELRRKRLGLSR